MVDSLGAENTTPTIPSITTTVANDLLVAWFINPDLGYLFIPAGDTQGGFVMPWTNGNLNIYKYGGNCCSNEWFDQARPNRGSTGDITSTDNDNSWIGYAIALQPAS